MRDFRILQSIYSFKALIFILGLGLTSVNGYGLDPNKSIDQYIHNVWLMDDGLPMNTARVVTQTKDGYIWIGTESGLARFDGVKFDIFTSFNTPKIKDNDILSLLGDSKGGLWLGTRTGGLFHYTKGSFHDITLTSDLTNITINTMMESKNGSVWVGTNGGLVCIIDEKVNCITQPTNLKSCNVLALLEDKNGQIWFGTENNGLFILKKNGISYTPKYMGLKGYNIRALLEDKNDSILVATRENGLMEFKSESKFSKILEKEIGKTAIRSLYRDNHKNIWIGTYGKGLLRYSQKGVSVFNNQLGLSSNSINSIFEDVEGNLWIGTTGGGLNCLLDSKVTTYTTRNGLSHDILYGVFQDSRDRIWIGTLGFGVNYYQEGRFFNITKQDGLSNNNVLTICEDQKGNIWLGTYGGGINRIRNKQIDKFEANSGLSDCFILSLCVDNENTLWAGSDKGYLFYYRQGRFYLHKKFGFKVITLFEDLSHNLWVGTLGGGLHRLNKDRMKSFTKKDGLSSDSITCIFEHSKEMLMIGTHGGGINFYNNGRFVSLTKQNGLPDQVVWCILTDRKGDFWVSSNQGIIMIDKTDIELFLKNNNHRINPLIFGKGDGMKSIECNGGSQPPGWATRDGQLWFPTTVGISAVNPEKLKSNKIKPPVVIEKVIINQKSYPVFQNTIIPPVKLNMEIHYTGLSFVDPDKVLFKYKLEGFDDEWQDAKNRRIAYYTNVPPGEYNFTVSACNSDGIWNTEGAAFKFTLKPFFFQTWWFFVLCGLGISLIGIMFYRLRIRQLKNRKKELEQLVNERTVQLKGANKELEKLSIVASETDNAVIIMDPEGNIEWINDGFTRMYEDTLEQLFQGGVKNLLEVSSNQNIKEIFSRCVKKREVVTYESLNKVKSGKEIWAQTTLTPILDENGIIKKIISIDSDVSKIKEAEVNAEVANQSKSEFLARMSHEIRTPMNSIIGFADMLLDSPLSEEQIEFAKTICKSGEALITLLNDILDFSKIEAGELSFMPIDFDPELTVFDICELVSPQLGSKSVELLCRVGDDVPAFVRSDPGRMRQVIVNLMGNASKFTETGEVELSLDVEEEEQGRLKLHIKVRDTGIGIPEDKLEEIFAAFHQADGSTTRKYGGTGLGLAICKQISKLMGGNVWVESEVGQGSTFHFTCWVDKTKNDFKKEFLFKYLAGKRALIVDDNKCNLEILSHFLQLSEMEVVQVTNPNKAINAMINSFKENKPIDICILDIEMPLVSGWDLAIEIRKLDPPMSKLPILAFSSSTLTRIKKYENVGFNGFLPKPIQREKLLKMVERLLGKVEEGEGESQKTIMTQHTIREDRKHSVRILLVEDNPVNLKLAKFILEKAGYQITVARDGEDAIEKYSFDPQKYDLILMDIQMPKMDGREATKKLREKGYKNIPIIAMTAEAMKGDREKSLEAGMNDYLAKPIKREAVYKMVKKWCLDRK